MMAALALGLGSPALGANPDVLEDCDIRVTRTEGTTPGTPSTGLFQIFLSDQSEDEAAPDAEHIVYLDLHGHSYPDPGAAYNVKVGYTDASGVDHTVAGVTLRPKTGPAGGDATRLKLRWKQDGTGGVRAVLTDLQTDMQFINADVEFTASTKLNEFKVPVVEVLQNGKDTLLIRAIFEGRSAEVTIEQEAAGGGARLKSGAGPVYAAAPPITSGVDLLAATRLSVLPGLPVGRSPYAWRWRALGR